MTDVTVWTGGTDTDWHTAGNWDDGVPSTSKIASIPSAPSNQPTMSSDGTAHALQLDSGATLTGGSNITLYITGESAGETDAPPDGMAVNLDGDISSELSLNITYNNTTSVDLNATSGNIHDLTLNHASLLINSEDTCELDGDLIITEGTFNANGNVLTVAGNTSLGKGASAGGADEATLTCAASTVSLGSTYSSDYGLYVKRGGTFVGGTGEHTMGSISMEDYATAKLTLTTHTNGTTLNAGDYGSDYIVAVGADSTITSTNSLLVLATSKSEATYNVNLHNHFNDLTINSSGKKFYIQQATTLAGDFKITAGDVDTTSSNHALTVAGGLLVESSGALTCNSSAVEVNGLKTTGGTVNLPDSSGSFTVKGTAHSGYGIEDIAGSGNIVHNGGTVTWDTGSLSTMSAKSTFNDIEVITSDTDMRWFGTLTLAGDLTIAANTDVYEHVSAGGDLTITGDVSVSGKLGNSDANSAYSFGSLTINSGGEYYATSDTTTIKGNFDNNDTDPTTSFVHNDGTVVFDVTSGNIDVTASSTSTGTHFYNVKDNLTESTNIVNWSEKATIEKDWDVNAKTRIYGTIFFGTSSDTSSMTVNTGPRLQIFGGTLSGNSVVYPAVFSGDGIDYESSSGMSLSNLDWSAFSYTVANNPTITLDGDMKFGALTINDGTTLDLNGKMMEMTGAFTLNGTLNTGGGYMKGTTFNIDGTVDEEAGSWFWADTSSGIQEFYHADFVGDADTTIFCDGNMDWYGNISNFAGNLIVGDGQLDDKSNDIGGQTYLNNLTVAHDGKYDAEAATINLSGDLKMSGGLIGMTGLYNNDTYNVQFDYDADQQWDTGASADGTIEGWFKADSFGYEVLARSNGPGKWLILMNTNDINFHVYDNSNTETVLTVTHGLSTDKWFHLACVADGTSQLFYINGKLVASGTKGAGIKAQSSGWSLGANPGGSAYMFDGHTHNFRIWKEARTAAEIRANMFKTAPTDTNSKLAANINFMAGGSGGTITDAAGNGNGTLYEDDGGHTTTTDAAAWAAAASLDDGTSTIDFKDDCTWYISDTATEYYNVKVAASGKTTTLYAVGTEDRRPVVKNFLTVGGGTLTDGGAGAGCSISIGGSVTTGADLSGLYFTRWQSSTAIPELTTTYLNFNQNCDFAGDQTAVQYIQFHYNHNIFDYNITTARIISYANSSFTMGAGTITFTSNTGWGPNVYDTRSFSAGPGATIKGYLPTDKSGFAAGNNWKVVGTCENLNVTNEELRVTGKVINCTGDIIQQHPSIDADQQLDYDTADDRDVMLGRDLDKNTELVN